MAKWAFLRCDDCIVIGAVQREDDDELVIGNAHLHTGSPLDGQNGPLDTMRVSKGSVLLRQDVEADDFRGACESMRRAEMERRAAQPPPVRKAPEHDQSDEVNTVGSGRLKNGDGYSGVVL